MRGRIADIDLDLSDTLELLFEDFQFAAMGRAEARKGNLLLTLDLLYLNLDDEQTTARGLETEVDLTLLITELGAGYRLGTWPLGPTSCRHCPSMCWSEGGMSFWSPASISTVVPVG